MKQKLLLFSLLLALSFNSVNAQDHYLGEIKLVPYAYGGAPYGWAECNGQLLPIAQYSALFSLIGTTYGGDGQTNFALPDLRGRVPIHVGQGPGLPNYQMGETGGSTQNTLAANNLPQHNHPAYGVTEDGNAATPSGNYLGNTKLLDGEYVSSGTSTQMHGDMIGNNSTTNQPVNNMQPYLGLRYIIALTGIFPSFN